MVIVLINVTATWYPHGGIITIKTASHALSVDAVRIFYKTVTSSLKGSSTVVMITMRCAVQSVPDVANTWKVILFLQ